MRDDLKEMKDDLKAVRKTSDMTLAEIGRVLGVTESRVCQIHTKAVFGLRSRMESAQREPV